MNMIFPTSKDFSNAFIESLLEKSFDPARWIKPGRDMKLHHLVVEIYSTLGLNLLLTPASLLAQLMSDVVHVPEKIRMELAERNRTLSPLERISASELLFGVLNDNSVDTLKASLKHELAVCLKMAIEQQQKKIGDVHAPEFTFDANDTSFSNLMQYDSPWQAVAVASHIAQQQHLKIEDSVISARLREFQARCTDATLYSKAKRLQEDLYVLETLRQNEDIPPHLRRHIDAVLPWGLGLDLPKLAEKTLNTSAHTLLHDRSLQTAVTSMERELLDTGVRQLLHTASTQVRSLLHHEVERDKRQQSELADLAAVTSALLEQEVLSLPKVASVSLTMSLTLLLTAQALRMAQRTRLGMYYAQTARWLVLCNFPLLLYASHQMLHHTLFFHHVCC